MPLILTGSLRHTRRARLLPLVAKAIASAAIHSASRTSWSFGDDRKMEPPPQGSIDTRASLLDGLRLRDETAWNQFVQLFAPLIYSWCRRAGLSPADSADLLQLVLSKVWAGIANFELRSAGSFRGWLRVITRHALLDFFRRRRDIPLASGGDDSQRQFDQTPAVIDRSTEFLSSDLRDLAQRAFHLLRTTFPPQAQRLFELTVLEDRSAAEAAAELGLTPAAVRKAKSRILKRLREILEDT
jgi:RNA polymerase sigma-70 factor (ECF subfamily)